MADNDATTETTVTPEAAAQAAAGQVTPDPEVKAEGQGATAPDADAAGQDKTKPETAAEDWKLTAPEGLDAYKGDFEEASTEMSRWRAENPPPSPEAEEYALAALNAAAAHQATKASSMADKVAEQHAAQVAQWEKDAKSDPVIGGAKYDENIATALKGLSAVADPEFRALMDQTGLGNHPAVIRAFLKVGQQIADTPVVKGTPTNGAAKSLSSALYGS